MSKAKDKLAKRQSAMRTFIEESNAKCKKGTSVLTHHPNREWAGDMPKSNVPARTGHANERMAERGVTDKQATDAILNPLKKFPIEIDNANRKSYKSIGKDATVIVNPDTGEIITAYPTKTRHKNQYSKEIKSE